MKEGGEKEEEEGEGEREGGGEKRSPPPGDEDMVRPVSPRAAGPRAVAALGTDALSAGRGGPCILSHTHAETPSRLRLAAGRSSEQSRAHTCAHVHTCTHVRPGRCAYHSGTPAHALADQDERVSTPTIPTRTAATAQRERSTHAHTETHARVRSTHSEHLLGGCGQRPPGSHTHTRAHAQAHARTGTRLEFRF